MSELIEEAYEFVQNTRPCSTTHLVARLGCELEQVYSRNRQLDERNRHIRRSYKQLKVWYNRMFKYYKAHRDELLNEKDASRNRMDGPVLHRSIEARQEEPRI